MSDPTESTASSVLDPTTHDDTHAPPPPAENTTDVLDHDHHAPPPPQQQQPKEEVEEVKDGDSSSSSSASSSSSSDEETEKEVEEKKPKVYRLFGREKPVHQVLGGGKPAEVLLWRNKKISASALGGATAIYVLFEILEYHLLTLFCHILILLLSVLFLWSNVTTIIHKSPPCIPDVHLPQEPFHDLVLAVTSQINWVFSSLRDVASGKDLKQFLVVIAGLWVLSVVGNWCNFLTLFYTAFVILHTVPVLYEKYEDKVDSFGEKAAIEMKKHYAVVDEKVLSKIPKKFLKDKKKD